MKLHVPGAVTRTVAKTVLQAEQNSPALLFGAGITLGVATVVTACRATLKIEDVLVDHEKTVADIKTVVHVNYSERDRRQDMMHVYIRTAARVTKLYGPSLVLGVASVACLTKSHRILSSRNAALTAAYTAVDRMLKEYRVRVREEVGEEKEREIYYNVEKCDEDFVDANGDLKTKKVKRAKGTHMYQRLFGPGNHNWNPNADYNIAFLRSVQNHLNERLQARGHLMLNEAYDELGLSRTSAGTQVGWLWQKGSGDNYVDFGIWDDKQVDGTIAYMRGMEEEILIDFNVDGAIWKRVEE